MKQGEVSEVGEMSKIDSLPNRPLTKSEVKTISELDSVERVAFTDSYSPIVSVQRGEFDGSIIKIWIDWGEKTQPLSWKPGEGGGWRTPGKFPDDNTEKVQFKAESQYQVIG